MNFKIPESIAHVIEINNAINGFVHIDFASTQPLIGLKTTKENSEKLAKESKLDKTLPIELLFENAPRFKGDIYIGNEWKILVFINTNNVTAEVSLTLEAKSTQTFGAPTGPMINYPGTRGTSSVSGLGF